MPLRSASTRVGILAGEIKESPVTREIRNVRVGGKKKEREREKGGGRDKVGERNLANENGAIFNPSPRI